MGKLSTVIVCAAFLGAGFMTVDAQTTAPVKKELRRAEHKFLEKAAEHNLAEIHAGKLAAVQASSREVKNFAKQMAQEHARAYEDVVELAQAKRVSLPGQPDRSQKQHAEKIRKLGGPAFDREYMSATLKDHGKDVKAFQKMSRSAKDPDVKAFALKTLPALESQLNMARELQSKTKNAG